MFNEISWPKLIAELIFALGVIAACVIMLIGVFNGGSQLVNYFSHVDVDSEALRNGFVWAFSGGVSARVGLGILKAMTDKD